MKSKLFGLSMMIGVMVILTGCIAPPAGIIPSSVSTTRDYPLTGFTRISAGYAFELEVSPGDYKVAISAPDNIIDRLEVSVVGNILQIKVKDIILGPPQLKAKVTLPRLEGLDLSGAVRAKATGFKSGDRFDLRLSGASRTELEIETGNADFDISGASNVSGNLRAEALKMVISGASHTELKGTAVTMNANVSGASQMNLADMTLGDSVINLSGASQGIANINGKLDIEVTGGSVMRYGGSPVIGRSEISGGSRLEKR